MFWISTDLFFFLFQYQMLVSFKVGHVEKDISVCQMVLEAEVVYVLMQTVRAQAKWTGVMM
jgi:hypothetical protein